MFSMEDKKAIVNDVFEKFHDRLDVYKRQILKGELYKTAIYLRESAENAKADKLLLKDALSDISHQLKTCLLYTSRCV